MRASALIARLAELVAEHGDMEVDTAGYPCGNVVQVDHEICDGKIFFVIEDSHSVLELLAA